MGTPSPNTYVIHSPSIPMTLKDSANFSEGVRAAPTAHAGLAAILEMHENSESSALFYVVIVLVLYVLALTVVLVKYLRTERYENRLTHLYDQFTRKERLSKAAVGAKGGVKKMPLVDGMVLLESNV